MSQIIWIDAEGKEIKREVKGRGRPPRGADKRDDGNFYVSPSQAEERFAPKYLVLDSTGKVVQEEQKGRGRAKPGFEKAAEGEHQGHWIKREVADSA